MNQQKELAVKVTKYANELTEWDFQLKEYMGIYCVETMISSQKEGWWMIVSFVFRDSHALLKVWNPTCRQDDLLVYDKLMELSATNAIIHECGMFSTVFGEQGIGLNILLPSILLERMTDSVIKRVMIEMVAAMAEIMRTTNKR